MATITVRPWLSPRVVVIDAPATSITIQELTNLMKDWEDEPPNLSYPVLVETSGKEALGGGTVVGITAELQNAKVAFEQRVTTTSSGTATLPDSDGRVLIDSLATFISDGVTTGSTIVNFDDQSITTVISVDSETQLTHEPLSEGVNNDWGIGDSYKVWVQVECEITGGNLVAVDENSLPISPRCPTSFTTVTKENSTSAALVSADTMLGYMAEMWKLAGLDANNPLTVPAGTGTITVDDISIDAVVDCDVETTLTRQP